MSAPQFSNLHLWLESTRLPYPGYDHILSKQIGKHLMSMKRTSPIWILLKIIITIASSIVVFFIITYIEGLDNNQIEEFLDIFNLPKYGAPTAGALITFASIFFALFILFPVINLIQNFFSALTGKYFVISLAALAILGGTAALYIPSYTGWFKTDTQQSTSSTQPTQNGQGSGNHQNQSSKDSSSDLRLHLLYITGGIIAVLGLIETNRKNSQDHIREVHAARRDRYIKAVDKLSSDDAPVRLGGVYALVGLVDEWLDDDNIDEETRIKEGQIIINNLCSYIRSPFLTAEKIEAYEALNDFSQLQEYEAPSSFEEYSPQLQALYERHQNSGTFKDFQDITANYAELREEQDVRRAIFAELSKHSNSTFFKEKHGVANSTDSDAWAKFDFDFSRATIFYPLNALTIEKGNFSSAKFYGKADFREVIFIQTANFNEAVFTNIVDFGKATFAQTANFNEATFMSVVDFSEATFTQIANFNESTFSASSPEFVKTYEDSDETYGARFAALPKNQEAHNFTVSKRGFPVPLGNAEMDGKEYRIPVGTVVFDPASDRTSKSAK